MISKQNEPIPIAPENTSLVDQAVQLRDQSRLSLGEAEYYLTAEFFDELPSSESLDPFKLRLAEHMLDAVQATDLDDREVYAISWVPMAYSMHHTLDEKRAKAYEENVIPRMRVREPGVKELAVAGEYWARGEGEFGIGDFVFHTLTSEWTPAGLRLDIMAFGDVPSTDYAKFSQNRDDGETLGSVGMRSMIHSQTPGYHELIEAAVCYYDTHKVDVTNPVDRETAKKRLEDAITASSKYYDSDRTDLQELDLYDSPTYLRGFRNGEPDGEPYIDVFRRLEANTRPSMLEPPKLPDESLDKLLTSYAANPHPELLAELTGAFNAAIKQKFAESAVGIEREEIEAIVWVDQMQAEYLRSLTTKSQADILKDPVFRSTLEYIALTTDPDYDPAAVTGLLHGIADKQRPVVERKKQYMQYVLTVTNKMARSYTAQSKERWAHALWTGNSIGAVIALAQNA